MSAARAGDALEAVLDAPGDDQALLAAAARAPDDLRARSMRLDVERRHLSRSSPRWEALAVEERELRVLAEKRWGAALAGQVDRWTLRSGLVHAEIGAAAFLERGARLLDEGVIDAWGISRVLDAGAAFFDSDLLARVRAVDLTGNALGADGVRALCAAPWGPGLRWLKLDSAALGDAGVSALAAAPVFAGLRSLSLADNRLGAAAFTAIAAGFGALRTLTLSANAAGDAGVAALAGAPHLAALRALALRNVRAGEGAARALAGARFAASLHRLDLSRNALGDAALGALAAGRFDCLEELDLSENDIGAAGIAALAAARGLGALRTLGLEGRNEYEAPPAPSLVPLADSPALASLALLRLSEYQSAGAGAASVRGAAREIACDVTVHQPG
jgi:hypothetical protein